MQGLRPRVPPRSRRLFPLFLSSRELLCLTMLYGKRFHTGKHNEKGAPRRGRSFPGQVAAQLAGALVLEGVEAAGAVVFLVVEDVDVARRVEGQGARHAPRDVAVLGRRIEHDGGSAARPRT